MLCLKMLFSRRKTQNKYACAAFFNFKVINIKIIVVKYSFLLANNRRQKTIKITTVVSVVLCSLYFLSLNNFKLINQRCETIFLPIYTSLLAGKFDQICTAFSLPTILARKLTGHPVKIFYHQKFKEYPPKNIHHFVRKCFVKLPNAKIFVANFSLEFFKKKLLSEVMFHLRSDVYFKKKRHGKMF